MNDLLELSPGTVFAGDYRVVQPLSAGGMGAVYVVEQLRPTLPTVVIPPRGPVIPPSLPLKKPVPLPKPPLPKPDDDPYD